MYVLHMYVTYFLKTGIYLKILVLVILAERAQGDFVFFFKFILLHYYVFIL